MSAPTSPAQRTRRSRRSIANVPSSSTFDQENDMPSSQAAKAAKKSRSKSLGPGGLATLREASGNSQKVLPAVRSILKPVITLSPPKPIPPRTPRNTDGKQNSTSASGSPSKRTRASVSRNGSPSKEPAAPSPAGGQHNQSAESVALRTEEEQQAAARARERAEAIKRRDERRKSLANRRVSFAPEATLHTWDVVELNEDATTSSEATNSTRRNSTGNTLGSDFTHGTQHTPGSDPADVPSTPAAPEEDPDLPELQNSSKRQNRRSSGVPHMDFNNHSDASSSPGSIMADDDTQSSFITNPEPEDDEDISDTDTYRDDVSEAMEIDEEDATGHSVGSMRTDDTSSSSSSAQLDARLRQAIQQAGTQRLDAIETGAYNGPEAPLSAADVSQQRRNETLIDADFAADHEEGQSENGEETGAMEMTQAVGGILNNASARSPSRRGSRASRRRSSGASSAADDQTMDFTTAVGGIRRGSLPNRRDSAATVATEDEDMSMELTGVIGGLVNNMPGSFSNQEDDADNTNYGDMTGAMEVTTALGRILSPVTERTEPSTQASASMDLTTAFGEIQTSVEPSQEDATATMDLENTMTMDVTKAIGRILPAAFRTSDRASAKRLMEEETEHGQLTRSPMVKEVAYPQLPQPSVNKSTTPENAPSPLQAQRLTPPGTQRNALSTPTTGGRQTTPVKAANTPVHQITPRPAPRPTTPSKTPPNRNVAMRRTSPRKLFSQSTRERKLAAASPARLSESYDRRATIDPAGMNVTLTPQLRRLSGQGADQAGLGSPKIAAILDRRSSIGDAAQSFTPQGAQSRGVHFADPRELESEVDKQREEDLAHESGREALEREANSSGDRDTTLSLRDMINNMTPKKKRDLKGRKSLAVGSARGLLGKRPAELDDAEEESPKRLQGPDRSPVKSIRLPAPPSKLETTGRLGRSFRSSLGPASGNVGTPTTDVGPVSKPTTPRGQERFRDAAAVDSAIQPPVSFTARVNGACPEPEQDDNVDPIQLQDFLNLINVRFMDLETTKRRHTIAPRDRTSTDTASDERNLDDCVVAGVSTVPMLELYQHSCRELKKYISEGRNIVREIESDTYEDNPALFKEYMSAAPDVRMIMDNQFKNVKSHARLLSRAMWYEWRMKLLDGLKDGLIKIAEGLVSDSETLSKQEAILGKVVPSMAETFAELSRQEETLLKQAEEYEKTDKEELNEVRQQLALADTEWEEKTRLLAELKAEKKTQDEQLARLNGRKQQCLSEIAESQKLCDEFRGWKMSEVAAVKAQVDAIGKASGWTIASASEACLEMQYRHAVSLLLKPSAFEPASADPMPMRLTLVSEAEPSTQERFFLQLIRTRLHTLDQASTPIGQVLSLVSSGWDVAMRLKNSVSDLTLSYITDVAITGDESLTVNTAILLRDMRTKVHVNLALRVSGAEADFATSTHAEVKVMYGEELKEGRMAEFLASRLGADKQESFLNWSDAVRELETRLIARGKK